MSRKYLKWRSLESVPATEIDHDRDCAGCGYNLRGLKTGGRCPECGLVIEAVAKSRVPRVILPAEPTARARMEWGLATAAFSLGLMMALRAWVIAPFPRPPLEVLDWVSFVVSLGWVVSVWLITPAALDEYGRMMRQTRWVARCLAFCWPIAYAVMARHDANATVTASLLRNPVTILYTLGSIGVLATMTALTLPAYDAGCDWASKRLITAIWGLAFLSPFAAMIPRGIAPVGAGWFAYSFISILVIAWAIFAGIAVACLLNLALTARSASVELRTAGARSERIREKRADIDRDVSSRIRPFDTSDR